MTKDKKEYMISFNYDIEEMRTKINGKFFHEPLTTFVYDGVTDIYLNTVEWNPRQLKRYSERCKENNIPKDKVWYFNHVVDDITLFPYDNYNMIRTEKDYQDIAIRNLKTVVWWRWYKIPDANMQIKPFDIIGFGKDEKPTAIELKIAKLRKWLSYEQAYSMLRPNQVWALKSFQTKGGLSFIWVYNILEEKEYKFEFKFLENHDAGEL